MPPSPPLYPLLLHIVSVSVSVSLLCALFLSPARSLTLCLRHHLCPIISDRSPVCVYVCVYVCVCVCMCDGGQMYVCLYVCILMKYVPSHAEFVSETEQ